MPYTIQYWQWQYRVKAKARCPLSRPAIRIQHRVRRVRVSPRCEDDAVADTYKYDSDADAAAFGVDERLAQGGIVPPDPCSIAQAPPRISSFCVCARAPSVG